MNSLKTTNHGPTSLSNRGTHLVTLLAALVALAFAQNLLAQPVAPGPVAWYSFDDAANLGADSVGALHATQVVNVSQVPGRVGPAGSFTAGYLQLPTSPALDLLDGDFTLAVFVNSSDSTNRNWFAKATASIHRYGIGGAQTANFFFDGGSGGGASSTTPAFDGEWHHVAAVRRGTIAEVWIDGLLEATGAITPTGADDGAFAIGRDGACCEWFNGLMDEAKIWDRALSEQEIGLEAGDLIFADEFESGDVGPWSITQLGGGDLAVTPSAAFSGAWGVQATIDDTARLWVQHNMATGEPRYRARFYFNPNSISMANGDQHKIFALRSSDPTPELATILFRRSSGRYQLRYSVRDDLGERYNSPWLVVENRWTAIEIDWQAATAEGSEDGTGSVWVDGVLRACVGGLDNDAQAAEQARLGAIGNVDTTTEGTYYFDTFESRRTTYIGPLPNSAVCWLDPSCHGGVQRLVRDVVSGGCVDVLQCQQLWKCVDGPPLGTCGGGNEDCTFSPGCADGVQRCFDGICTSLTTCTDRMKFEEYSFDPGPNDCDCANISPTNPPTTACSP